MATTETYAPNRLYTISLAELMPDPNQPRKYFDPVALEELTASIARNNVMSPIFFRVEDGLNPKKKSGTGESVSAAQGAFNAMDVIQRKITTLDMQTLTPEEKQNFIIAMNNLKQAIEDTLASATEEKPSKNLA